MDDDNDEENDENVEEREPQVTSSDPNERKLARKLRIERRLEAIRKLNVPEGEEEEEIIQKTLLQQQLQKSYELLDKLTIEATEHVTNVRVANDSREVDRREEEEIGREKILEQLEAEAASAQEQFVEIAEKWTTIMNYKDPLQIHDEILAQKEKCDELIRQKDEFIAVLKSKIRTAEVVFAKDQRKQTEDVETLSKRIDRQVSLMRRAYRQELQIIEDVIMVERKMLIDANDKRWEELHRKRDQDEEHNCDIKFEQLEEFEEICTKLRIDHQEKYREIKIKLGNDIENLEQELEKIKILALMNSEKLDYNYQVLKKREDENIIIKSQQKRRINKLQDSINTLRHKTRDYLSQTGNEIEKLTKEVEKLQASVLDIEEKADSFAKINDGKFKQIWDFNRKRVGKILADILATDKILYEQQLGLKWVDPEQRVLEKTDLPSYKSAIEVVSELYKKGDNYQTKEKEKKSSGKSATMGSPTMVVEETMGHRRILRIVLKMIADKSGFLIEERMRDVLKPFSDHERTLVKIDSVFAALSIKRREDVEILLEYFLPYAHCPICMAMPLRSIESSETELASHNLTHEESKVNESEIETIEASESKGTSDQIDILSAIRQPDDVIDQIVSNITDFSVATTAEERRDSSERDSYTKPSTVTVKSSPERRSATSRSPSSLTTRMSCRNRHPLVISSVYVLRALRQFVSKFYVAQEEVVTMTSRLSFKRSTVSRLIAAEDVTTYWERLKKTFSAEKEALWDGLTVAVRKYHEVLKDRKKLNDEVTGLRRENSELKRLLACYRKDAQGKMGPPCARQREIPVKRTRINL